MPNKVKSYIGYVPHKHQEDIHFNLKRFSVLVCHRRFGKTVLAINALIDAALKMPKNTSARFGYCAPYLKQAKQIAWLYVLQYGMSVPGARKNESELWVEFPNGARVTLYGADNAEAMRGLYLDGIVLDEVADMKPYVWGEIVRPALADRKGWCLFIGTPKGLNQFYDLYQHAMKDPGWYAGVYRADETKLPWLDDEELALARATQSENQYRQEWLCDFSASMDNVLITIDMVSDATKRHATLDLIKGSPRVIGVDVARFGDDRSVIQKRQGLVAWEPVVFRDIDNMDLAGQVARTINEWQPDAVFIDAGRGEGVIDRLRQLGHQVVEVNFGGKASSGLYVNKRSEMWDSMAEWLRAGGIIPNDTELKTDLSVPTYSMAAGDKMALESKDDIKKRGMKSPDLADALALTFAHPVRPKVHPMSTEFVQQHHRAQVIYEYDPLDAV
jgi:hypothetical protein